MNHGSSLRKLGRSSPHRKALFRNLATSLVLHDRIETTLQKAKDLRRVADKLVTLGKRDTLHSRRQAMAILRPINKSEEGNAFKLTAVHKLFTEIAPRYTERNGGYTRVLRTKKRPGDCAQLAIIEFVEGSVGTKEKKKTRKVKRKGAASEGTSAAAESTTKAKRSSKKKEASEAAE